MCVCVCERERERACAWTVRRANKRRRMRSRTQPPGARGRGRGGLRRNTRDPPPPLLSVPRRPARRSPSESRSTKETPLTGHEVKAERAQQEEIEAVVIILEHGCDLPSSVNALGLLLLSSSGGRLWRRLGGAVPGDDGRERVGGGAGCSGVLAYWRRTCTLVR